MLNARLFKESNYKKLYKVIIVLIPVFNSIFVVISAFTLSEAVNAVFLKNEDLSSIKSYLLIFFINAILKGSFNFLTEAFIKNSAEDIKENIKAKGFEAIISGNPYRVKKEKLGEIINILTDGMDMLTPYYSQYIPQLAAAAIIPTVLCVIVAIIDKPSALIMLVTYPIIPLFMVLIGYKSKQLNEKQWKKLNILSSHFVDMLQGISTLKVFGRSKIQEQKVYKTSENYRTATIDVLKVSFSSALVLELFSTISTALIAVNLGLRLVYNKIDFLNAFFILIIAPDFYLPVRNLGLRFHASLNGKVAIEKIDELTKKLEYESSITESIVTSESPFEIEVKNLSYSYGNKAALNNISLKIRKGEKVALVGESGSGKSTLINILSGFLKVPEGKVFINGKDINYINKEEFLREIALVPQFPHVFNKSLEENISLGISKYSREDFLNICKITKLQAFQEKLEAGYGTLVGEGERVELSGGEIQRIALARVLLKNSNIVILDEPSSALDSKSEALFPELMEGALKNTTIVIAAHRLNTIKAVDKIFVLQEGNLIEEGSQEELIGNKNKYFELVKALEVEA